MNAITVALVVLTAVSSGCAATSVDSPSMRAGCDRQGGVWRVTDAQCDMQNGGAGGGM